MGDNPGFVRVVSDGRPMWLHQATGRLLPVIAGGSEDLPDDDGKFQAITTQDDLNRIIAARLDRERSKFADYDELKDKAAKFDELEENQKTELQKASDRAAAAEQARDQALSEALRLRIAVKHGISDEDANLFLTGTDEDTLTKQAERLAKRDSDPKGGPYVPQEGGQSDPPQTDDLREFTKQLFKAAQD